jgi:hypothetical protein
MTIALEDTSVFCEIVPVPGRSQHRDATLDQFEAYIREEVTLLLPIATILETGNHIGHIDDGHVRRRTAERFVALVQPALGNVAGPAPWTVPDPLLDPEDLQRYLDEFPDCAMRGLGLGDLSILKEFERQCELNQAHRVFIWSLDDHLAAYDRHRRIFE